MLSHHRTVPKISYHLGKDRNHEHQNNTQIETANASKIQQVVNNCRLNCWQCLFQVFFLWTIIIFYHKKSRMQLKEMIIIQWTSGMRKCKCHWLQVTIVFTWLLWHLQKSAEWRDHVSSHISFGQDCSGPQVPNNALPDPLEGSEDTPSCSSPTMPLQSFKKSPKQSRWVE